MADQSVDIESRLRRAVKDRAAEVEPVRIAWEHIEPALALRIERRRAHRNRWWISVGSLVAAFVSVAGALLWL